MNDRVAGLLEQARQSFRDGFAMNAICLLAEAIEISRPNPIRDARQTLWRAFLQDPSFAQTYIDNIACVIMDYEKLFEEPNSSRAPLSNDHRQALAHKIFQHLFREEV